MQNSTKLHRQVHPKMIQDNKISVQVFEVDPTPVQNIFSAVLAPKPSDNAKLSVYNGDKYTAEESFNHYTQKLEAIGVVTVTVEECQNISLPAKEDNDPFDGHSHINFEGLSKNQVKAKAQLLKAAAVRRNWTFKR